MGTDYIGSCKSNYHTIMATTAPLMKWKATEQQTMNKEKKKIRWTTWHVWSGTESYDKI
jgi:hypothetical protein